MHVLCNWMQTRHTPTHNFSICTQYSPPQKKMKFLLHTANTIANLQVYPNASPIVSIIWPHTYQPLGVYSRELSNTAAYLTTNLYNP